MPLYLVNGANTMNLESTTNSASASGPEFESQSYRIRVRDVSLIPNGQTSVRGFSLATLAAALAACGGGSSGGPAAPPPPPPPPPANTAPTASPDAGAATEDGEAVTGSTGGADEDGGPSALTYSVSGDATYGSLTVADDGTWTYTVDNANDAVQGLAEGAELSDTATITVSDGEDSVEATVTITITGVNDAPTGDDGAGAVTAGMDMAATGDVNPADVDASDTHTFEVGTAASNGTLTVDEAGAWTYMVDHDNEAVVALAEGATMEDTATIVVTDNNGATAEVTVTITITGANDDPTGDDGTGAVTAGMDMAATGDVNAMDVDVGDTHTFEVGTAASNGTLTVDEAGAWSYALDHDNEAVVALAEGATMEDTATIVISDNNGGSAEVTVTITITGVNEAPTAEDGAGAVTAGMDMAATGDVNAADVDVGDTHTFAVGTAATYGTLTVDEAGAWSYALDDADATVVALDGGEEPGTLTDTATVMVTDNNGATDEATVTITITGANDDPTISVMDDVVPNEAMTPANAANDENMADIPLGSVVIGDPDSGQMLSAENVTTSDPDRFIIKTDDDGGLWLNLAEGVSLDHEDAATVDVTVTVTDDHGATAETVVTITVNNVDEAPDAPTATPSAANLTVAENDGGGVNLAQLTSSDPEGDDISYAVVDNEDFEIETVGNAVLLKVKDGVELDYEATMNGTITLMVTASDPAGNTSEGTAVVVTVTDVNEAPSIEVTHYPVDPDNPVDQEDLNAETPKGTRAFSTIEEESTGPVGLIVNSDPESSLSGRVTVVTNADGAYIVDDENGNQLTFTVSDPRFSVKEDPLGGLWLFLNEGVDADMEGGDSITVTVTVSDGEHTAMTEATINITNVNEPPTITVEPGVAPAADGGAGASGLIAENATGPVYEIIVADQEGELTEANVKIDDARFDVETDSEGGLWAVLNEEVNYEELGEVKSIDIVVTVTDSGGMYAMATQTVTITDVNDAPEAAGDGISVIVPAMGDDAATTEDVTLLPATAGQPVVIMTVDLDATFTDQDEDTNFRYTLGEDTPDWVSLINVVYVTNDDGTISATGDLVTAVPALGTLDDFTVTIVATDEGGAEGTASFTIIVDDGNDKPRNIKLSNTDGTDNPFFDVDTDENDASGMVLGYLTVEEQDNPLHPNGMLTWSVSDEDNFEIVEMDGQQVLKVVDGVELDHEMAASMPVKVTVTDGGGEDASRNVTVEVNDTNDAPIVANEPGNWWVTVPEDLDADDVTAGQWLKFGIETATGETDLPLFTDEDADETLAYSLVSHPAWLEIDAMTGEMQNAEGMVPERGVHDVTVSVTDDDGDSAMASFQIAVVRSDEDNEDNYVPKISGVSGIDIDEDAGAGTIVGTFTVTEDDLDVAGLHPWGDLDVVIVSAENLDEDPAVAIEKGMFEWELVSEDSDSKTYNVKLTAAGAALDHEDFENVRITVRATDGVSDLMDDATYDEETIRFDVNDVNEAPIFKAETTTSTDVSALTTAQGGDEQLIYLNLTELFEDDDRGDSDDELTFGVVLDGTTPWITVEQAVAAWGDIKYGADGEEDGEDDLTWGPGTPDDDDMVAIIKIDHSMDRSQSDPGSFSITATDEGANTGTQEIMVAFTDADLSPAVDAEDVLVSTGVTLSDTTLSQGDSVSISFDSSIDPDFTGDNAGTPIVVLYQWSTDNDDEAGSEDLQAVTVNSSVAYTVTQAEVDNYVVGGVVYYELVGDNQIVESVGGLNARTEKVQDRQDEASGSVVWSTNELNELVATVTIDDPDGFTPEDVAYTWEYSVNGRGGWIEFDDNELDNNTAGQTTLIALASGHHVRLVATFTDAKGAQEEVISESIRVGDIATQTILPEISGPTTTTGAAPVGAPMSVNAPAGADVQWQAGNDTDGWTDVGTGNEFTVTTAQQGMMLRAIVTSKTGDAVTSIVTTGTQAVVAGPGNTIPRATMESLVMDVAGVAGDGLQTHTATVDMASLFEDLEGGLTFTFGDTVTQFNGDAINADEDTPVKIYEDFENGDINGDQLLIVNEETGEIHYYSTLASTHDGSDEDGLGNMVTIALVATDTAGDTATVMVSLRIDVAGEEITVDSVAGTTIEENAAAPAGGTEIATVDVQDENATDHAYGTYTWAVSDTRFEVVEDAMDGSAGMLKLKAGATLDYEADGTAGLYMVTVTATPVSGGDDLTVMVEIMIGDVADDTATTDPAVSNNTVPGLKDDEGGDDDDDTQDDESAGNEDDDEDAGTEPEADAMAAMASMLDDGLF